MVSKQKRVRGRTGNTEKGQEKQGPRIGKKHGKRLISFFWRGGKQIDLAKSIGRGKTPEWHRLQHRSSYTGAAKRGGGDSPICRVWLRKGRIRRATAKVKVASHCLPPREGRGRSSKLERMWEKKNGEGSCPPPQKKDRGK